MEQQVRITKIAPGKMDDFVEGWTASVARLHRSARLHSGRCVGD